MAFYFAGSKIKADLGGQSKINAFKSTSIVCVFTKNIIEVEAF